MNWWWVGIIKCPCERLPGQKERADNTDTSKRMLNKLSDLLLVSPFVITAMQTFPESFGTMP